jgi:hypothetical protein
LTANSVFLNSIPYGEQLARIIFLLFQATECLRIGQCFISKCAKDCEIY